MLRQFFTAAVSLLTCCGAGAADRALRLSRAQPKSIELKEDRATGYVWRIDPKASSNLDILRIEDNGFSLLASDNDRPLIGAPGVHRWSVEALSNGRARIEFVYQRPWEQAPIERQRVSIDAPRE